MKTFLTCLLLLTCLGLNAQAQKVFLFTNDSIGTQKPDWYFAGSDKPDYAAPGFNDLDWPAVKSYSVKQKGSDSSLFKGIGWFRLHFRLDSALSRNAIALGLSQGGASEVFLDGNKIYERGVISDARRSRYYDPQFYPLTVSIGDTLQHVLAVRYANWNYNNHSYLYDKELPGFEIRCDKAQNYIDTYVNDDSLGSIFCSLMFGVFAILAVLHLIFFLYYRQERSNLWFSLFCGSLGVLLLMPYVGHATSKPFLELILGYYSFHLVVLTCFALSGLLNQLFSRRPLRFRIVAGFYLLNIILYSLVEDLQAYLVFGVVLVSTLEAIVVIAKAIIRKVPGARIIGAGLSLFILMLLFTVIAAIALSGVRVHIHGTAGIIVIATICIALLSIPVSLSAYLALRFAQTSHSLNQRLREVEALSQKTLEQEAEKQRLLEHQNELLEHEVASRTGEVMRQKTEIEQQHRALIDEKKKSDDLLRNILPTEVAEELKQKGTSAARHYEQVSVLFTDIVDFTSLAEKMDPEELVQELNECFTAFDAIIERNGLEKIKTIGDAYMAVCGLPLSDTRHAQKTVQAALEIRELMENRRRERHVFELRIGINSGPVVAGIIGVKKFAYDIWGDTVNTAARMEQHGEGGRINISSTTYQLVKNEFLCTPRGKVVAKSKGEIEMYFVEAPVTAPAV